MSRARHRRLTARRKAARVGAVLTATLTLTGAVTAAVAYQNLNGNITALDTTKALGTDRPDPVTVPDKPAKPLNILLIGSDSRQGSHIGGDTPGLSDTTIVLHINADRTTATGISIPRDSMVNRPDCLSKDGHTRIPAALAMFNTGYALGGPGCTQRTVEQLTGIRIDHFAVVNLAGFSRMVNAIGGVPICVPSEVNDPIGHIHLPAGTYIADGAQALDYVRERHALSPNGDLGRMKRQQAFLSAMADKVLSTGTLTNPVSLYGFLDAATASLTTDPDLASLHQLAGLAEQMRGINAAHIRFLSIPTQPYAPDPNRLQWTPGATQVWNALRTDTPLPRTVRSALTVAAQSPVSPAAASAPTQPGWPTTTAPQSPRQSADSNGLCT